MIWFKKSAAGCSRFIAWHLLCCDVLWESPNGNTWLSVTTAFLLLYEATKFSFNPSLVMSHLSSWIFRRYCLLMKSFGYESFIQLNLQMILLVDEILFDSQSLTFRCPEDHVYMNAPHRCRAACVQESCEQVLQLDSTQACLRKM